MDFVLISTAAATPTLLLVAMFKLARSSAATWEVVLCALLAGEACCFLLALSQGKQLDTQTIATLVIAGFFAAATAAGVRSADNNADEKRSEVKQ